MPKYALEFLAEIQEVSTTSIGLTQQFENNKNPINNNISIDNNDKLLLLPQNTLQSLSTSTDNNINISINTSSTSSINLSTQISPVTLSKPIIQTTNKSILTKPNNNQHNVANPLMGNGQCCFKRYPCNQTHRHVVISRGIQCTDTQQNLPNSLSIITNYSSNNNPNLITDNHNHNKPNNDLLDINQSNQAYNTNERGDISSDIRSNYDYHLETNNHFKACNDISNSGDRKQTELFTAISYEPPELRESCKFPPTKSFLTNWKKSRKFYEDDIDSLSATISNYSLHEKLIKFDHITPQIDQNTSPERIQNTPQITTPTPKKRHNNWKGSNEAIRGSTTKTLTVKSVTKHDHQENCSSGSYSSLGINKDIKNNSIGISNSIENTVISHADDNNNIKRQITNDNIPKLTTTNVPTKSITQTYDLKPTDELCFDNNNDLKPQLNEHNNKSSNNVTFMRGSEEFRKQNDILNDNLNALRRKQKFLMKHSRSNSRQSIITTPNDNNNRSIKNISGITENNSNTTAAINLVTLPCNELTIDGQINIQLDSFDATPNCPSRNSNFSNNIEQQHHLHQQSSAAILTTQSNHLHHHHQQQHITPQITQPQQQSHHSREKSVNNTKIKRAVSFDRRNDLRKSHDNANSSLFNNATHNIGLIGTNIDNDINDMNSTNYIDSTNQPSGRNSVRAKYCSNKSIKHKFYIPESANIEHILRDPSDRRIKAICDRHNCDIEIYSKIPKSGFLKNIIILAAPNSENLRKCVRSLDCSMHWCLTAQLN